MTKKPTDPELHFVPFEEVGNFETGDDRKTLIHMIVGERGWLNRNKAKMAALAFRQTREKFPHAFVMISVNGYGDDPRELFQIPEARAYLQMWAKWAGLHSYEYAIQSLNRESATVLAACGAFPDFQPRVKVQNDHGELMQKALDEWLANLPKEH